MQKPTALTIAGSDCSGGAGIQADLKTMTVNGVYAMSVLTALTAQNTTGVQAIQAVTPLFLQQQLDAVFLDIPPAAVKIGMIPSSPLIRVIAQSLRAYGAQNIVLDPVMVATSGSALMENEAVETLIQELFPLATVITPNIPEAQVLSGLTIRSGEDMQTAAQALFARYGCNVLLKGGHRVEDANDLLVTAAGSTWIPGVRIDTPNTHGTGCTLSSAIVANLAKGFSLPEAVRRGKVYLSAALSAGLELGKGPGPMDHGFALAGTSPEPCPAVSRL